MMTEIVFLTEDNPNGGYSAKTLSKSVLTQANHMGILPERVRDAVHCQDWLMV